MTGFITEGIKEGTMNDITSFQVNVQVMLAGFLEYYPDEDKKYLSDVIEMFATFGYLQGQRKREKDFINEQLSPEEIL